MLISRLVVGVVWVLAWSTDPEPEPDPVFYVDDNAPLGGDGSTWTEAYKYLQDALASVSATTEIRRHWGVDVQ